MSVAIDKKNNRKIFTLAFLIALLILVNGGFAYWQMQQVKAEFDEVANRDLPLAAQLLPLIDRQFEQTLLIEKLHKLEDLHKLQAILILEDSFIRTGEKFSETSSTLDQMLQPMLSSPRELTRIKMARVDSLLRQIMREHQQYQAQVLEMIEQMKQTSADYPSEMMDILSEEERDLSNELISLRDQLQNFTQDSARAVAQHEAWVIKGVVAFTLFAFMLGSFMLYLIRQVMQAREQALEQINFYACHDPLTNLYNRRHFFEALERSLLDSVKVQSNLSLCVCDLDHFKSINDQRGHQTGDRVLETFAEMLKGCIRNTDFVGRFGGDEFVICFPDTCAQEAAQVVERVRRRFAEKTFKANGEAFNVTSTFGVAQLDHFDASSDSLMEAADSALYQAKDQGRNTVVFFAEKNNTAEELA